MRHVVFLLPYFGENSRRYLRALLAQEGVRVSLVHQQSLGALPEAERRALAGASQVSDPLDERQVIEACRDIQRRVGKVDRIVAMLEQTMHAAAAAREALEVPGLWMEGARNFRDKDRMKAVLREAGLPVARSMRIESTADLHRFVSEVGFPIVVKPLEGLGSRATVRVRSGDELRELAPQMNASRDNAWQAEEFVTGEENTFEAITLGGRTVWWSGTWYRPGPLTVLENPWIQYTVCLPRVEDSPEHVAFKAMNERALYALGQRDGISHMEWFKRADGSFVISEVAARPPGVHIMPMMGFAHDFDMIQAWAGLVTFERFTPRERRFAAGCAFFRAQGPGERVVRVRGLDEAQREVGAHVIDRHLPRLGQARSTHYEGEGWAIVRHEQTSVVEHALRRLVTLVRIDAA
ncbi:MAG TPA: ATP-grasp domain-containing protein [Myxococcota bacterium]|nr:ATP-grasp domain-containing protein [Myxococcota bacterium]